MTANDFSSKFLIIFCLTSLSIFKAFQVIGTNIEHLRPMHTKAQKHIIKKHTRNFPSRSSPSKFQSTVLFVVTKGHNLKQGLATHGLRAGFSPPIKIIRPGAPLPNCSNCIPLTQMLENPKFPVAMHFVNYPRLRLFKDPSCTAFAAKICSFLTPRLFPQTRSFDCKLTLFHRMNPCLL